MLNEMLMRQIMQIILKNEIKKFIKKITSPFYSSEILNNHHVCWTIIVMTILFCRFNKNDFNFG